MRIVDPPWGTMFRNRVFFPSQSFSTLEAIPTICIRTFSSGDAVLSSPTASFVDAVTKSIPCLLLDTRSERAKAYRELCESEQVEQKSAKEVEHDETQHRSAWISSIHS